jgi:membrane fusion protein (multidrug efflux system)
VTPSATRSSAGLPCRAPRTSISSASERRPLRVALAFVCVLAACGGEGAGDGAPQGPPPATVEVLSVALQTFEDRADLLGELQAENSVFVRSEMPGIIEAILFEEGAEVEAGSVLFQLRDREQNARLHEAEAELALAQEDFTRTQKLARLNAAAAAQLDKAASVLAVAKARTELRRVELERTRIRAPFAGRAGARLVSPGARIKADDQLVRLDAMDPLALVFTVPEVVLPLARIGAEFSLDVAAFPGRRFPGAIRFIAPSVDSASRRILIKGRVPNPDRMLLPGMFARVEATLGEREAMLVPEEALVTTPEGNFVWRVGAGDEAERVPVEVGMREPGRVELKSGLSPGDRIVTAGTHKLRPGAKVKPVPALAAEAPAVAPSAAVTPGGGA